MEIQEAREKFVQSWGTLGSQWGINRTMAQIHALLLVSPEALSADEVMEELHISRGNANMNLRALIDWGLVYKKLKSGERKEFFIAEKDIWEVVKRVMMERKRRELEPVLKVLDQLKEVEGDPEDPEIQQFRDSIENLSKFCNQMDKVASKLSKADESWFLVSLLKLMK